MLVTNAGLMETSHAHGMAHLPVSTFLLVAIPAILGTLVFTNAQVKTSTLASFLVPALLLAIILLLIYFLIR
jgi:hypothetical protein